MSTPSDQPARGARPPGKGGRGRRRRRPHRDGKPPASAAGADSALEAPRLDASQPADAPLAPEEAAEMKQHLRFLFRHRKVLRLKVNAAEDLLLNGARPPTHRGVCLHLLSKVDLATVESALTRLPDAKGKSELLAGAVRFSTDVGILLLYLESLTEVGSRSEAAAAFDRAVGRIDFTKLSAARMRRVLDLIATTFAGHERVKVLFDLLGSRGFREAFDASAERLPDALAGIFLPLRAVHEVIFEGQPDRFGPDVLAHGVTVLLEAPVEVLRNHPETVRVRLLEDALVLVRDPDVADRATAALLDTLDEHGRAFSTMAMLRAAELMRRHEDAAAIRLLRRTCAAHPGFKMPGRWLQALEAPRLDRMALTERQPEPPRRLQRAFWLDGQRAAWVRRAAGEEGLRLVEEARLQRDACLPGVAPVLRSGVTEEGDAWLAVPAVGRPGDAVLGRRLAPGTAALLALQAAQVLHAVGRLGLLLPDAGLERFLVAEGEEPLLVLADLGGVREASPADAVRAHLPLGLGFARGLLGRMRPGELPPEPLERARAARDLVELVQALAACC